MILALASERLTISIESGLAAAVRDAAVADEQDMSEWLTDAARRRLVTRGLHDVVADWEAVHEEFIEAELSRMGAGFACQ